MTQAKKLSKAEAKRRADAKLLIAQIRATNPKLSYADAKSIAEQVVRRAMINQSSVTAVEARIRGKGLPINSGETPNYGAWEIEYRFLRDGFLLAISVGYGELAAKIVTRMVTEWEDARRTVPALFDEITEGRDDTAIVQGADADELRDPDA